MGNETESPTLTAWSRAAALGQDGAFFQSWDSEAGRQRFRLQQRAAPNLNRHLRRSLRRFLVLLVADITCAAILFQVTRAAWSAAGWPGPRGAFAPGAAPFVVAFLVGLAVSGNYGPGDRRRSPARILLASAVAGGLLLWGEIWSGTVPATGLFHLSAILLTGCACVTERLVLDRIVSRVSLAGPRAKTLLVGPAEACREVRDRPAFQAAAGYEVVGFVETEGRPSEESIGGVSAFSHLVASTGAETVVLCGYLSDHALRTVLDAALAAGCQVLTVPRAIEVFGVRASVVRRDGMVLVELTEPSVRGRQLLVKRLLDVVAAALGLVLLSPLLALVAALIKADSPGPIFFRQVRIGRGGRPFLIIKFRTMRADAERTLADLQERNLYRNGRLFKLPGDPRVTRVGRILRRTSLDELPQLLNTLRGEMSLVGPRPPLPSEVAHYEEHHYSRLDMTPGITGPWQVAGRNLVTDFEEIVRLERDYTQNWDLNKDLAILLRTVPAVFRMQGAL